MAHVPIPSLPSGAGRRSLVPEAKLLGRDFFRKLPDDTNDAIRHLDVLGRGSVFTEPKLGRADPRLPDPTHVDLALPPGRAVSPHGDRNSTRLDSSSSH